jgi:hypothetical protein
MQTKISKPITEQTIVKVTLMICATALLIAALLPLFQTAFWGKMGFFYVVNSSVIMIGITLYSLYRSR